MTGVVTPDNVVQFKAVPYATIPGRFKRSIMLESISETDRNFTKPGFGCPQIFPAKIHDGGPHPEDASSPAVGDEYNCLILHLNIPLSTLQSPSVAPKPPILIYIHGGGFVLGRIDESHNTAYMVEQSISDSQPTIAASIQYRLGALGSLYTPEPGTSNRGLNDQRNALLWIQKFIAGFGGDPKRVTLFAESAGSLSICDHMLSKPPASGPLFNRVILMSGVLGPMTVPHSVRHAEEIYDGFLRKLGIEERGEKGLAALREVDVQRIVDVTAEMGDEGTLWWPVLDEDWFGDKAGRLTWDSVIEMLGECKWVDEIVLGTTGFEGTSSMGNVANVTPQTLLDGVADQLGPQSAALVSEAYKITPNMDQNLFVTMAMRWIGDVIFEAPTHALAKHLSNVARKKVYRYVFDVRNPFPNHSLYQLAHHWVDVYFVFRTLQFRYPTQRLKDISTRHAQFWIDFANGKAPWTEYDYGGEGTIMVADEREGWVERSNNVDERVRELSWKSCEVLLESWEAMRGVETFRPLDIAPFRGKKLT